jgi:hypothetical protein
MMWERSPKVTQFVAAASLSPEAGCLQNQGASLSVEGARARSVPAPHDFHALDADTRIATRPRDAFEKNRVTLDGEPRFGRRVANFKPGDGITEPVCDRA